MDIVRVVRYAIHLAAIFTAGAAGLSSVCSAIKGDYLEAIYLLLVAFWLSDFADRFPRPPRRSPAPEVTPIRAA